MKKHITIDIKEVLEFESTLLQKEILVRYILFELMSVGECNRALSQILKDLLETEKEFDNKQSAIGAYKAVIKILSNID